MKINNKGFTLIELMVTVAIIGILGTVAVPAYQDYTVRSQVTEGLSLASGAKVQVAEYYSNHGRYPEAMADIGMMSSLGGFIQETRLDEEGKITAVFGNNSNKVIHNETISLIPFESANGNLKWNCESSLDEKYLPTSCNKKEAIVEDEVILQEGDKLLSDGSIHHADGSVTLSNKQLELYAMTNTISSAPDNRLLLTTAYERYNYWLSQYHNSPKGSIEKRNGAENALGFAQWIENSKMISDSDWPADVPRPITPTVVLDSDDPNIQYYHTRRTTYVYGYDPNNRLYIIKE